MLFFKKLKRALGNSAVHISMKNSAAGYVFLCSLSVKAEQLYVFVHGVLVYFFHIVEVWLRHIYTCQTFYAGHNFYIMITSSAKMYGAASEMIEEVLRRTAKQILRRSRKICSLRCHP